MAIDGNYGKETICKFVVESAVRTVSASVREVVDGSDIIFLDFSHSQKKNSDLLPHSL